SHHWPPVQQVPGYVDPARILDSCIGLGALRPREPPSSETDHLRAQHGEARSGHFVRETLLGGAGVHQIVDAAAVSGHEYHCRAIRPLRVRPEEEGRDLGACAGASTAAGIYLHLAYTCGRTLRVGAADSGGSFWGRGETVADPQQFAQASAPCLGIGGRPGHGAGTPALPSPLAVTGHLRPSVRCCDALHRPVPGRCACARWSTHRDGPPVRSLAGYSCPGPPVVVAKER